MAKRYVWKKEDSEFLIKYYDMFTNSQLASIIGCALGTINDRAKRLNLTRTAVDGVSAYVPVDAVDSIISSARHKTWEELSSEYCCSESALEAKYISVSDDVNIPADYFSGVSPVPSRVRKTKSIFLENYRNLGFAIYEGAILDLIDSIVNLERVVSRGDSGGSLQLAVKRVLCDESAFFGPMFVNVSDLDAKFVVKKCWANVGVDRDTLLVPRIDLVSDSERTDDIEK